MILVTGGTGLLGGHLLLALTDREEKVRCLIRHGTDRTKVYAVWKHYKEHPERFIDAIEWVEGDVLDRASLEEAMIGITKVYHCAARVSFDAADREEMLRVNVDGTANVVNACLSQENIKLIHVSSIAAVNKSIDGKRITEDNGWPVKTRSVYSYTKTKSELEVWRGITEGLNAVIVNPSVILGPGNWQESSCRIFETINNGLQYFTNGIAGYVGVRDVVNAMILLMENNISGERFILNSDNLSFKELFDKIAKTLGKKAPKRYASPFILSLACRGERLRSFFTGKSPRITKESVKSAIGIREYSAEKFTGRFNYTFQNIDTLITETGKCFISSND